MKNQDTWLTADEMRFFRRELINNLLHVENSQVELIRKAVRYTEVRLYSMELKRYYYYEYHY